MGKEIDILKRRIEKNTQASKQANTTVFVRNELLEALFKSSNLTALKVLFFLSKTKVDTAGKNILTIPLDLKELNAFTNTTITTLRRNLTGMQKTQVAFVSTEGKDKVEDYVSMLPRIQIKTGKNSVKVDIYTKVYRLISHVNENFSKVLVSDLLSVNSIYAFRMLMLLERFNGYKGAGIKKQGTYDLDELNALFSTNYKRLNQFEVFVLAVAKKDLEKSSSNLSFEWELNYIQNPSGRGRPKAESVTIIMTKTRKMPQTEQTTIEEKGNTPEISNQESQIKKQSPNKGNAENIIFNEEMKEIAKKHDLDELDGIESFTKFKNYQLANNAKKVNWLPMFENWIINGKKFQKPQTQTAIEENFYHARIISEEVKGFIEKSGYSVSDVISGELEIEEITFKTFPVPIRYGKGMETLFSFKNKAMNDKILSQYTTTQQPDYIEAIAE